MADQEEREFTALEAVVSVAEIRDAPDKLLLTVWANGQHQFVLSRRMAKFLAETVAKTVEKLSLPPDEH